MSISIGWALLFFFPEELSSSGTMIIELGKRAVSTTSTGVVKTGWVRGDLRAYCKQEGKSHTYKDIG